jgi:hypothetical protein
VKAVASGILCFILGVLLALLWRPAPPPPPLPVAAPVCSPCPGCGEMSHLHPQLARPPRPPRATKKDAPPTPLPELAEEQDARRDALREWFAAHGQALTSCRGDGEPRKKLLMQMKLEPDGSIAEALPIGAADLSAQTAACVVAKLRELRVPPDLLRGRETALIHLGL